MARESEKHVRDEQPKLVSVIPLSSHGLLEAGTTTLGGKFLR